MEQVDDSDLLVQRAAVELLKDLRQLLPRLIFSSKPSPHEAAHLVPRDTVNTQELEKGLHLLDAFQESPQLLDPVLAELLDPLSSALVTSISFIRQPPQCPPAKTPLPLGVCKLLYSFCKIRGAKVISRFLSNEARHIAPLLEALEARVSDIVAEDDPLSWEERYILLLWMSHLVLTPFSLSSAGAGSVEQLTFPEKGWPVGSNMPFISRLCRLGHYYLSSSSKERDAAVTFLVRLILRPDMQGIGLPETAMTWAHDQLELAISSESTRSIEGFDLHRVLGILSFVAGLFNSADASLIAHHVVPMFQLVKEIGESGDSSSTNTGVSAVGRKLVVKIFRSCVLAAIKLSATDGPYSDIVDDIVEDSIGDLLSYLSDQDAPVRLAASKALSVVVTKLEPDMATEVIEAIIASLDENVLWHDDRSDRAAENTGPSIRQKDLSLVSPFRWQGLTLTLAHLLFRRAPTPSLLPMILNSLLMGLSFEQRSTTGTSVGNTVRDAANFGIWSLARRYTTAEISSVDGSSIFTMSDSHQDRSVLQALACELVCTACLDPVGNVRRGASAALQELIGRHPDTIANGISIVQTVDYHSVSLISRSMTSVVLSAARLSREYHECFISELIGWRGIFAIDLSTRRLAAKSVAALASLEGEQRIFSVIDTVWDCLSKIQARDVGNRHGILLALADLLSELRLLRHHDLDVSSPNVAGSKIATLWGICSGNGHIDETAFTSFSLRPVLTAEAFCSLLVQLVNLFSLQGRSKPSEELLHKAIIYVELGLSLKEEIAHQPAANAGTLLLTSGVLKPELSAKLKSTWISRTSQIIHSGPGRQSDAPGWLCLLSCFYTQLDDSHKSATRRVFIDAMGTRAKIETRVSAMNSMTRIIALIATDERIVNSIQDKLQDYTTDARGDIGSLVRIAALECVKAMPVAWFNANPEHLLTFKGIIFGLAAEKLDKVRGISYECLTTILQMKEASEDDKVSYSSSSNTVRGSKEKTEISDFALRSDVSSIEYFRRLLDLANSHEVNQPFLLGLATTVSGASETASEAARAALADHLIHADETRRSKMLEDLVIVLQDSIGNDRTVTAVLETIAYVLQSRTLSCFYAINNGSTASSFKKLFALVQKAHLKSTILPKLLASVELYASLARVKCVRTSVRRKLLSMLAHPFPKVRSAVAESLWCATLNEVLLPVDWTKPTAELKGSIEAAKTAIVPSK